MLAYAGPPQRCPLCDSGYVKCTHHASRMVWQLACPACGEFEMTWQGEEAIRYDPAAKDLRHLISAATRQGSDLGQPILIKSDNWRSYAEGFLGVSVATKVRPYSRSCASAPTSLVILSSSQRLRIGHCLWPTGPRRAKRYSSTPATGTWWHMGRRKRNGH